MQRITLIIYRQQISCDQIQKDEYQAENRQPTYIFVLPDLFHIILRNAGSSNNASFSRSELHVNEFCRIKSGSVHAENYNAEYAGQDDQPLQYQRPFLQK